MALAIEQYDLFDTRSYDEKLRDELFQKVDALKASQDKSRRKLFGMVNDLMKIVIRLEKENDNLRQMLLKEVK